MLTSSQFFLHRTLLLLWSQNRACLLRLSLLSLLLLWWLENDLDGCIKDSFHILYFKRVFSVNHANNKVLTNSYSLWINIDLILNIWTPAVFLNYTLCKQEPQSPFSVPLPSAQKKKVYIYQDLIIKCIVKFLWYL